MYMQQFFLMIVLVLVFKSDTQNVFNFSLQILPGKALSQAVQLYYNPISKIKKIFVKLGN